MAVSTGTNLLLKAKALANHTSKCEIDQRYKSCIMMPRRFSHISGMIVRFFSLISGGIKK